MQNIYSKLIDLMKEAVKENPFDFAIICGLHAIEEQKALIN